MISKWYQFGAINYGIIPLLIKHGADVKARDNQGRTPLHRLVKIISLSKHDGSQLMQLLIKHGADIKARDNQGRTPLHRLVKIISLSKHDGSQLMQLLIKHGADIKARDNQGVTLLHVAAKAGQIETMEWLFQHGADVNAVDNRGLPPSASVKTSAYYMFHDPRPTLNAIAWLITHGATDIKDRIDENIKQTISITGKKVLIAIIIADTKEANSILGEWPYGKELPNEDQKKELNPALPLAAARGQTEVVDRIMSGFPTYLEPMTFELALIATAATGRLDLFTKFYNSIREHYPDRLGAAVEERKEDLSKQED